MIQEGGWGGGREREGMEGEVAKNEKYKGRRRRRADRGKLLQRKEPGRRKIRGQAE